MQWGEEHGMILDKKGRVWGCGRTNFGLLGQQERELDEKWFKPRQITYNLPEGTNNAIVDVRCGSYHSLAITKQGDLYSWGMGDSCRLGLGFIKEE